jgi:uncharacterized protein YgfB (UPF0149 family)
VSELDAYLAKHYMNAASFADTCGISVDQLSELISDRMIPAPSYVVTESTPATVCSYAFGELPAPGSTAGSYFHPAHVAWVKRAQKVVAKLGRGSAYERLKQHFEKELQAALAELDSSKWRLRDCFNDDGSVIAVGLRTRLDSYWDHFLHGTFGLCVARPDSEYAIVEKEVLQEELTALSDNGAKRSFTLGEASTLLELIDEYERVSMPFSPIEYPVSSRKRLVDDLRAQLLAVR